MATSEGRNLGGATLRLYVNGLDKLVENISKFEPAVVKAVVAAAEVGQARVVNSARRIVPVRTGALQNSIGAGRIVIEDNVVRAEIVAGMNYATYVEKRKPYLGPALLENEQGFLKSVQRAVADIRYFGLRPVYGDAYGGPS